jgi:hypothetical protein
MQRSFERLVRSETCPMRDARFSAIADARAERSQRPLRGVHLTDFGPHGSMAALLRSCPREVGCYWSPFGRRGRIVASFL